MFSTVVVPEHDLPSWSHYGAWHSSFVTLRGRSLAFVEAEGAEERQGRAEGAGAVLGESGTDRQTVPGGIAIAEAVV